MTIPTKWLLLKKGMVYSEINPYFRGMMGEENKKLDDNYLTLYGYDGTELHISKWRMRYLKLRIWLTSFWRRKKKIVIEGVDINFRGH